MRHDAADRLSIFSIGENSTATGALYGLPGWSAQPQALRFLGEFRIVNDFLAQRAGPHGFLPRNTTWVKSLQHQPDTIDLITAALLAALFAEPIKVRQIHSRAAERQVLWQRARQTQSGRRCHAKRPMAGSADEVIE
jgi:hypothetical protein